MLPPYFQARKRPQESDLNRSHDWGNSTDYSSDIQTNIKDQYKNLHASTNRTIEDLHFEAQIIISIDSVDVTGLSILSKIPSRSNWVLSQTIGLTTQVLLTCDSFQLLQLCPLADATTPFQSSHHLPLQCRPLKDK